MDMRPNKPKVAQVPPSVLPHQRAQKCEDGVSLSLISGNQEGKWAYVFETAIKTMKDAGDWQKILKLFVTLCHFLCDCSNYNAGTSLDIMGNDRDKEQDHSHPLGVHEVTKSELPQTEPLPGNWRDAHKESVHWQHTDSSDAVLRPFSPQREGVTGRKWEQKGMGQLGQNFPSGSCAGQEGGIGGQTC